MACGPISETWRIVFEFFWPRGGWGLFGWAVEGCLAWQREGLRAPDTVTNAIKDYRDEQNIVGRFVDEKCTVLDGASVTVSSLFDCYAKWCRDEGVQELSKNAFGRRIGALAGGRWAPDRGNGSRIWRGLGIRADPDEGHGGDR